LGIGDWGLGIGDWAQSPIPNPQSPIPNPQYLYINNYILIFEKFYFLNNLLMENDYIPHQNLEDPDRIIANSKLVANDIFANSTNNFRGLNRSMKDQNDFIDNNNNKEIENNFEQNSNILLNENIGGDAENLKFTIYQKLSDASNQLIQAKEQIKFLTQENSSLKNIIANKDKIISDFEELSLQSKYKFEKMENIIRNLKRQLQQKNINIDMNNNDIKICEENNMIEKKRNDELIYNLQNIQDDLDNIENDYQKKLKEKDCCIEQLNCEIINIYQEYIKLSDVLEELNYLVKNSDYNELKTEFNCLLREKEILLREKERNHNEIITLREKFLKKPCTCGNEQGKINELVNIFNMKEKNYLEEIDSLKKNLREKIMEIEELQKEEEDIVREYELRIQNIMNNNNQ